MIVNAGTLSFFGGVTDGGVGGGLSANASITNIGNGHINLGPYSQTMASFALKGGSVDGAGTLSLLSGSPFDLQAGNISESLVGSSAVAKTTAGLVVLTGNNAYTGSTVISAGTLQLGNGGATGSIGSGSVINDSTILFDRNNVYAVSNSISGSGKLVQGGSSAIFLTGQNTYSGGTIVSSGVLSIGAFGTGTTGSIVGDAVVAGSAQLWFNRADSTSFDGNISGNGLVAKFGSETLTLTGSNTYTGGTVIWDGTLQIGNGGTTGSLLGNVSFLSTRASLSFNRSDTYVFNGFIDAPGSVLQVGTGKTILAANNAYNGGTTIFSGTLQLGNGGNTGSIVGNVTDNSILAFNRSDLVTFSGAISGTGAVNHVGTGTTILTNTNTYTGGTTISAGLLQLGNGGTTGSIVGNVTDNGILAFNRSDAVTFSSVISGSGAVQQNGSGKTTLTGANTYTGGTIISAGSLQLGTAGSTASIVGTVLNNGTFSIVNANTDGITNITNTGGSTTFFNSNTAGTATINDNFQGVTQFKDSSTAGNSTIFSNSNSGGLFFTNSSSAGNAAIVNGINVTTQFSDNSTAGSATIKNGGTPGQGIQGNIYFTGNSTGGTARIINDGTVSIEFLTSAGMTVGSIEGGGYFALGSKSLTVGSNNLSTEYSGEIGGESAGTGGSLTKVGSGTLTLTGSYLTSYTGGTTISGGTLQLGNGGTSGSIIGNVLNNATFAINRSDAVTFDGAISGTGVFQQKGVGTTTLTGTNTYTGGTVISAGTLQLGDGGTAGSIVGNATDNGVLAFNRSDAIAFSGAIVGSGAVSQIGPGTTTLTGTNTYTGPTTVTAGTLTISGTGSITSNVTNIATFNNAGTITGSLTNSGTASNSSTITNGLTNAAGTTTNIGTINGGATVIGGTLNTNAAISIVSGGLANAATVNAAGAVNGPITNAGAFAVTGVLTSDNAFSNLSGGTLSLGAATYTLEGLLANSGMVSVASGGQLIATVGGITNYAGGSITVAVGGAVRDDLNNGGIVTNNGSYFANVGINVGTITNNSVWTGNIISNVGTITNNLTWVGSVTNAGTFNNIAGATVSGLLTNSGITNNAGTLSGGLTNTAGVTTNTGSISGTVNITGGALIGNGRVANLSVGTGSMFAPGDGTAGSATIVSGNLAFQSGAFYLVQINPTTASLANVTGTAALNGAAVYATYANGRYVSKRYTILTAAGGVSGTFNLLANTNLPTNFRTALGYDTNHAYLDLILNFGIPGGLNGNQQSVGNALTGFFDRTGSIPMVFGALSPGALTQASGEIAAGTQQATFNAMGLFMGLLTDPFVAGRDDPVAVSSTGALQFADESYGVSAYASKDRPRSKSERDAHAAIHRKAPVTVDTLTERWSVWAAGYGGSQTTDGNAMVGSNAATSRVFGTAVGADYRFSLYTIAGFALAGGGTNFSIASGGTGRSDLFQAGAFVRHTVGAAYMTGALAYGWQDVTTNRTVAIASIDQLQAKFNTNALSGRVEGGYRFVTPWMGLGLTSYAAGQFTNYDLPTYAEQALSGTNTFALNYGAKDVTASRSELGLRTDKSYALTTAILTLRSRLAWAHNFNSDLSIVPTFQTLPGASFVVNGAAQARDAALTTASAELKWRNGLSLVATFEGEFSNTTTSYAGKAVARYVW